MDIAEYNARRCVPIEIWMFIFQVLSRVLDDSLYPPEYLVSWQIYSSSLIHRRLKQALRAKRAAAQVCKAWNPALTPLLYEHVILKDLLSFDRILQTLTEKPELGAHTRRLDLFLGDFDKVPSGSNRVVRFPDQLESILTAMPNLTILVIQPMKSLYASFDIPQSEAAKPLLAGTSVKLECIRWLDDKFYEMNLGKLCVTMGAWTRFLDGHPKIRSIQPPYIGFAQHSVSSYSSPAKPLHLPIVHTTRSNAALFHLTAERMQELGKVGGEKTDEIRVVFKRGEMDELMRPPSGSLLQLPILQFHGERVVSVQFFFEGYLQEDEGLKHSRAFEVVRDACPNLREFGFPFHQWNMLRLLPLTSKLVFPLVNTINLQCMTSSGNWDDRYMLEFLLEGRNKFPSLGVFQFLDERNFINMEREKDSGLDKFVEEARKDGIMVQCWGRRK